MTNAANGWTVLVLAGQRPGIDPLAAHFGETFKALVPIAGEAMVTRVVRTLGGLGFARIIVLGQDPGALAEAVAAGGGEELGGGAEISQSGAGISTSILEAVTAGPAIWPVLVTTADHPLLTGQVVEEFLRGIRDADVAVGMVEQQIMRARYPGNKRTWLKFSDGYWSGANLFALRSSKAIPALTLWSQAEQDRKKAWKLFLHFGPWLALRALTRTIGLGDGLARAGKRLGLTARLVSLSDAEAAIDVDKPSDHELASAILQARQSA